jgi:hypothetical protein
MAKKSLITGIILIAVLGLAGLFLVFPNQVRADIAISSELGSQSNTNTEVSAITSGGNSAISSEINNQTDITTLPGEGNFTTPSDEGGGGGGGGGGSSGSSHRRVVTTTTTTTCTFPYLNKYLKFGQANDPVEVAKLQRFLHDFQGFSDVKVTGIFDQPTLVAVMIFQKRYAADILLPWGLTAEQPTGYVFITTSLVINRLYCGYTTKHNLDLRHVYDSLPRAVIAQRAVIDKEGGGAITTPIAVLAKAPCATTSALVADTEQTAAVGFFEFLKDNLWFWLIPLLILILIFASYYLWREEPSPEELKDYDDDNYTSPDLPPEGE